MQDNQDPPKRKRGRPRNPTPSEIEIAVQAQRNEFLERMNTHPLDQAELALARQQYGPELPYDVLEQLARQAAAARPILEKYHLLHEQTPTLAMARAAQIEMIDSVMDVFVGMDLNDLGDVGEFPPEYTCPRCAHRWSGAPNYRTGYGDKVYVPTGKVSTRTGRLLNDRYGPPTQTVKDFKYGRNWRGAAAEKLPRGFGNTAIGTPLVFDSWRRKYKGERGNGKKSQAKG